MSPGRKNVIETIAYDAINFWLFFTMWENWSTGPRQPSWPGVIYMSINKVWPVPHIFVASKICLAFESMNDRT